MYAALSTEIEPEAHDDCAPDADVRVLLIDDDPSYRHLCQRYLSKSKAPVFTVVSVADGASALASCQTERFDCLLIDYSLPDLTGTQIIEALRERLHDATPPAIILTADGGEEAAAKSLRAGASDFLPKKVVSAESLARAINNAVEKGRLRDSVVARSSELQQAIDELKLKNDEIQRFYQSVSHEVKTPLAAAREFIAITLDGITGPVTDEQKEMLSHALDSCDQITAHFNDLIEMTRMEAGKVVLDIQPESLDRVVARCIAAIGAAVDAKQLFVELKISPTLPVFDFDCNRIIQVLSNLIGNAIKYSSNGSSIVISARHNRADGMVEISVADRGCGISPTDLPRVFERLYQVEGGGDEYSGAGLGLGLSIAKEIVELHGGDMSVTSVLGEGSTFSFRLPTTQPGSN